MYDTESSNYALLHHALQTMEMHNWQESNNEMHNWQESNNTDLWYSFPTVGAYLPTLSITYANLQ
jgi:hypothetical protein